MVRHLQHAEINPVLSKDQKDQLVISGEPINIWSIRMVPRGNYGPWWSVNFTSESYPDPHSLAFGANEFRDEFMADVQAQLAESPGEALEAYVVRITSKSGMEVYTLE